jgi:hypothetical protein
LAFAVVFWFIKSAVDAGRLLEGVRVRKCAPTESTDVLEQDERFEKAA